MKSFDKSVKVKPLLSVFFSLFLFMGNTIG